MPVNVSKSRVGPVEIIVDMRNVQGFLKEKGLQRGAINDGLKLQSMTIATRVAKLAKERLSVGGEKNIGVSGKAAENIRVDEQGTTGAVINEGPYPANFFIREGRSKGTPPPTRQIIDWIAAKGISVKVPPTQKGVLRWTKKGGARANLSSKPSRPFKRDLKHIASLIAYRIGQKGMTTLSKHHPTGQPQYDYYSEILTRTPGRQHFENLMEKTFDVDWFPHYIKFLRTGNYGKRSTRVRLE